MTGDGSGGTSNTVSGGTVNGPLLQGRDFINTTFVMQHAAAVPVALAQLPPLTAGFTGRETELAQMAALLDPAVPSAPVVVSTVAGLAGVGKTAMAVHAGHAAVSSGWFPGGVLFIDLHGYDPSPVQPAQALDSLLRALGVPGERIPDDTEARAALYRSALAQIPGSVLVIADNASAEAQVRLLVPGPGLHRVIITSRHTLAGLGARLLDVAVLDRAAATALLDAALRAARPDDDRISGDQVATQSLVQSCGGLPLALRITAALLVADTALTVAELADELADEVRRLRALRYDDGSGAGAPSVAAAFELSYRQLDEEAARIFRLLPADPGPDACTEAVAALAGWQTDRARAALGRLTRAHLIKPAAGARGRWRMHDLLRLFARQLPDAGPGQQEESIDRLLAWYLRHAEAADQHLRALGGTPLPAEFTGRDDALAWMDAERPNLIAAVTMAAATGRSRLAMILPLRLSTYLLLRRRFDDSLTALAVSRDSARQLNQKGNEAAALNNLGVILREVRRFEEAISAHQDAVTISRDRRDRNGERMALNNLGLALRDARRFEEAISALRDAVTISRERRDRNGEGMALDNLGIALVEVRRFDEAISAHREAAAIFQETGDPHGEGTAFDNLGHALLEAQRVEEAITAHRESVGIFQEGGDRLGEADALTSLGNALVDARRLEEAIIAHRAAVGKFREADDRHGEGGALNDLGLALREVGWLEEAIRTHEDAVVKFRESGDLYGEGQVLRNLGDAFQEIRQPDQAAAYWRKAAAAMRDVGDQNEATRLERRAANAQTANAQTSQHPSVWAP